MLTDSQIEALWQDMLAAENRSLYFADLASISVSRKQWVTALNVFLSSGAAAVFLSDLPAWIASSMALVVAALSAYSFAKLDGAAANLAKLHLDWSRIQSDYERLWNHTYADDAQEELERIREQERAASEYGVLNAPYDKRRMDKWQAHVIRVHFPQGQNAA